MERAVAGLLPHRGITLSGTLMFSWPEGLIEPELARQAALAYVHHEPDRVKCARLARRAQPLPKARDGPAVGRTFDPGPEARLGISEVAWPCLASTSSVVPRSSIR